MQNSDDYFDDDDDFVVDATVLAALDEAERKYGESQRLSQRRPSAPPTPPPPKRQKLANNASIPRPGNNARRLESLPDISVQGDGSYGVYTKPITLPSFDHTNHATAISSSRGGFSRTTPITRNPSLVASTTRPDNAQQTQAAFQETLLPSQQHSLLSEVEQLRTQLEEVG